jgi:hypothetical protein
VATTTKVTGSITVTSPNGGEMWIPGTTRFISWKSYNLTGDVDIQLSTDGGTTWTTIIADTENDGTEPWTIAKIFTSKAKIKVVSAANKNVYDLSNRIFSITTIASNELHIKSISLRMWPITMGSAEYVRATATVTIVDGHGNLIEGAEVYGQWSEATSENDYGKTSSKGTVSLSSNLIVVRTSTTFVFTVTDVVLNGYTYEPASNLANSAKISSA